MFTCISSAWIHFFHDDEGVTLVEYGIAIALAIAIGAPTMVLLASDISGAMASAGSQMP